MFDEILKYGGIVLGSTLLTTIITQAWSTWNERSKEAKTQERAAVYAALQIATRLESFALRSINALVDCENEEYQLSIEHGDAVNPYEMPVFENYPADIEWQFLDSNLAAYALAFPNEVELSRSALANPTDSEDPSMHRSDREQQVGYRGYRAVILASMIRAKYRLPSFHPRAPDFDFIRALRQRYENIFSGGLSYRHPYEDDFR